MRLRVFAVVAASVVLATTATTTAHSATTPSWTALRLIPGIAGAYDDGNPVVTCMDADPTCVALVEPKFVTSFENGSVRTVDTPYTGTGTEPDLNDIACASAQNCVAVGSAAVDGNEFGVGYRVDDRSGSWVDGPGTFADQHVACSTTTCVADGTYDEGVPYAHIDDRDGAGAWVSRSINTPWRTNNNFYTAVTSMACPPTGACVGTGNGLDDQLGNRLLFFFRSGTVWKAVPQPLPAGADLDHSQEPLHLSCASAGNCTGIGAYVDAASHTRHLYALLFRNGVLSAQPVATQLAIADNSFVEGFLDCTAVDECAGAVSDSRARPVLVQLHGGSWTGRRAPLPADAAPGAGIYPTAAACVADEQCFATGRYPVTASSRRQQRPVVWSLTGGCGRRGRSPPRRRSTLPRTRD